MTPEDPLLGYNLDENIDTPEFDQNTIKNIYGREKITVENSLNIREAQRVKFGNNFKDRGYVEVSPVLTSSGIDPTVRFIGSHISVFKPYLTDESTPDDGVFMVQDCIRTRNADRLYDDSYNPKWGSFFTSYGCLVPASSLDKLCADTYDFFTKTLDINPDLMLIRANSQDKDLMASLKESWGKVGFEVDSQREGYYRHKIGIDHIGGRNINIALRDPEANEYADVGNIIILETGEHKIAGELALGESTILKQLYGLNHVLDCHPIESLTQTTNMYSNKMADAIIISTTLLNEGLKPGSSENKGRILRTYMRSLSYFRSHLGINLEELETMIAKFSKREFGESSNASQPIINYLAQFESDLLERVAITQEEKLIKEVLNERK